MRTKQKLINLYEDSNIDSIKVVFSIGCEDDLNQCWNYFECNFRNENSVLQLYLTTLYNMANELIESDSETFFEVIVEQNERYYYFTIWNEIVSEVFAKILLEKKIDFINDAVRITAKIEKLIEPQICELVYTDTSNEDSLVAPLKEELLQNIETNSSDINIAAYNFLTEDDLEELLELCDDMVDVIAISDGSLQNDSYIKLRSLFSSFTLIVSYYEKLNEIATIMQEFTSLMSASQDRFIAMTKDEIALIDGFVNNLDRWVHTVFVKGGADLHFMDDSLKADFETIKMLIEPEESASSEDMDDIFDF